MFVSSPRLPGCRCRGVRDALRFEPPFGVDGRLASVGGGGYCLSVTMVVDITGDEDSIDLRVRLVSDDQVALVVDIEPVAERVRVRLVTDRHEQSFDRFVDFISVDRIAQAQALN